MGQSSPFAHRILVDLKGESDEVTILHLIWWGRIMLAKLSLFPNRLRTVHRCYATTCTRLSRIRGDQCVVQKKLLLTGKLGSGLTAAVGVRVSDRSVVHFAFPLSPRRRNRSVIDLCVCISVWHRNDVASLMLYESRE